MAEQKGYLTVTDMYPQEYQDTTMMYPFWDSLRGGKLTTTKCKDCGKISWPPRLICPECISDNLEWVDMPETGKIYTYDNESDFYHTSKSFHESLYT